MLRYFYVSHQWSEAQILLPGLSCLEGGLKIAEGPSPLCFLLRPPGGDGSAARTSARLLVLPSPAAGSDLPGADSLEDESSTTALLATLNSESWTRRQTETDREISELDDYEGMITDCHTLDSGESLFTVSIQNANCGGKKMTVVEVIFIYN